jgi:hypothetical protein
MTEFEQIVARLAKPLRMERNKYGLYTVDQFGDGDVDLELFVEEVLKNRAELLNALTK